MQKDWTGNKSAGSATPRKASSGGQGNSNAKAKKSPKPSYKAPAKQH